LATLINRSRYTVTVAHHDEHTREFPHDKSEAAREYLQSLRPKFPRARISQGDDQWYVRIRQRGYKTLNFDAGSYDNAQAEAARIEAERRAGLFIDYTAAHRVNLAHLIERYVQEVCPRHKGCDVETAILESLLFDCGEEFATRVLERKRARAATRAKTTGKKPRILPPRHEPRKGLAWLTRPLAQVMPTDINAYIHDRLADVAPATVDREIDLFSQVISWAVKTLRIELHRSPLLGVERPRYFNERDRRLKAEEEQRLLAAAREEDRLLAPELALERFRSDVAQLPNASARTRRLAVLREEIASGAIAAPAVPYFETYIHFLLLTAARRSEALAQKWADVDFEARSAFLSDSKNGRSRTLGLRQPMIEMLKRLPRSGERVFPFMLNEVRGAWERIRERAQLDDYHMHDLRHEALSRMCEVARAAGIPLTLKDLATMSGHRDFRCLARYLNLCAGDIARSIDEAYQIAAAQARAARARSESSPAVRKGRLRPRIHVSGAAVAREASSVVQLSADATREDVLAAKSANALPA
jgi:integrase